MKNFYLLFIVNLFMFLFQVSIQPQINQQELNAELDESDQLSDFFVEDLTNNDKLDHRPTDSQYIRMKDIKVLAFKKDHYAKSMKNKKRKQLNCDYKTSGELCDYVDEIICTELSFNGIEFNYHCESILPSNLHSVNLAINCEPKAETSLDFFDVLDPDEIGNMLILKGSCVLSFSIQQVDYSIIYLKLAACLFCFIVALMVMVCTFNNCRKSDDTHAKKIFLTPSYFTRSVSSSSTIFH